MERARIVFAIENEMSPEERNLSTNKYWTNIDNERYLQVEEVDDAWLRGGDDDGEDKDDNNKEEETKESDSESDAAEF